MATGGPDGIAQAGGRARIGAPVRAWLAGGDPGVRLAALALMAAGSPALALGLLSLSDGAGRAAADEAWPLLGLAGLWVLRGLAVGAPMLAVWLWRSARIRSVPRPAMPASVREAFEASLDSALSAAAAAGRPAACVVIRLDDMDTLAARLEPRVCAEIAEALRARAATVTREADRVALLDAENLAVLVAPGSGLDLEKMLQITARLQIALKAPLMAGATDLQMTTTLGFAIAEPGMSMAGAAHAGRALLSAAEDAMVDARLAGPGTVRAHTPAVSARRARRHSLQSEARDALAGGAITAWFQPQVSTENGRITGFEALARWHDPVRGWVPPAEFLPALAAGGQMTRLSEAMLAEALAAIRAWDAAGFDIPKVSINLSEEDLRDTTLARRIAWELDRLDIAPHRLGVEVLETVMAQSGDPVPARTLQALSEIGCHIDLDDFGTGHASITAIRAFPIHRIKIDRSFVTDLDRDPDKEQMIAAILTMAERLGVGTLAEGVETPAQRGLLAQYGCAHLQGFGIGLPMPLEACHDWIAAHRAGQMGETGQAGAALGAWRDIP